MCENWGLFAMPGTCEKWLGLVDDCVNYAHKTHKVYQGSFEILWGKQYLVNVVLFGIKGM